MATLQELQAQFEAKQLEVALAEAAMIKAIVDAQNAQKEVKSEEEELQAKIAELDNKLADLQK